MTEADVDRVARAISRQQGERVMDDLAQRAPVRGDWVVVQITRLYGEGSKWEAAQVERITAKMVYAKAGYRTQHSRENVLVMPDERSARLFEARARSARAEAGKRANAAWEAYRGTIGRMVLAAMLSGAPEPENSK